MRKKTAIPVAAALAVLFVASRYLGGGIENRFYEGAMGDSEKVARSVAMAQRDLAVLKRYQSERASTLDVMLAVTEALPSNVLLTRLSIGKTGIVQLSGKCKSHSQAEDITVKLNQHPLFRNAVTGGTSAQKDKVTFSVSCALAKWPGRKGR